MGCHHCCYESYQLIIRYGIVSKSLSESSWRAEGGLTWRHLIEQEPPGLHLLWGPEPAQHHADADHMQQCCDGVALILYGWAGHAA